MTRSSMWSLVSASSYYGFYILKGARVLEFGQMLISRNYRLYHMLMCFVNFKLDSLLAGTIELV